ncbi:amidohydrolase family protein [Sphingomonas sp. SUN039]|uniref:amidohydrolase family protein n=1 Tax=Sphingomonas sp. SUN039 TaxID=2937787 RepID=UPI0021644CE2|nr:amidohydrolase family protein [Sphingomonas sp. SUN039]UVO52768.1 amidohydrolase family protein [Sphingomonas sp. SUN039]
MTILALLLAAPALAAPRYAIIDMHMHAEEAIDGYGPPPVTMCAPYDIWPARDPGQPIAAYLQDFSAAPKCEHPVLSAPTLDALRQQSLAQLAKHNMLAVVSGSENRVAEWKAAGGDRVISAIGNVELPSIAALRAAHKAGHLQVLGEIVAQYDGIPPNDPRLESYYALAEELDIPVGIHVGPGPPGIAYFASPKMRIAMSRATLLEEVLVRHPRLRLYVMHAGWPFADDMIALLYAHPQVYVDTGIIDYAFRRSDFHAYLKRLIDAGFEKRIMFGSDQMIWPGTIDTAIAGIRGAPFLTETQKRDILHDNAARFLRIEG